MITIGICDDDSFFSDKLYHTINQVMFPISDWEPRIFHSGKEVTEAIKSGNFDCQLVFIDIMMNDGKGLQTAQYICRHSPNTDLIFATASSEHILECYHYHAFAYLIKPISESDISLELQRYLKELQYFPKYLTISFQRTTYQIPIHTILYIESNLRKVVIHTTETTYYCYRKLDEIEEILKHNNFVRCHQSYLVALDKITGYTNNQLIIHDTTIPVSDRYLDKVRKLLVSSKTKDDNRSAFSLAQKQKEYGALICTKGAYLGSIIRMKPEKEILVGRDGSIADMVINLPLVSRNHCSLLYHYDIKEYEITDFSRNGTFVNGNKRLLQNETYFLKPGSEVCFGDKDTIYKLG